MGPNSGHWPKPLWHKSIRIKSPAIQAELPYGDEITVNRQRMPFRVPLQPSRDGFRQREVGMICRELVKQAHLFFWP